MTELTNDLRPHILFVDSPDKQIIKTWQEQKHA